MNVILGLLMVLLGLALVLLSYYLFRKARNSAGLPRQHPNIEFDRYYYRPGYFFITFYGGVLIIVGIAFLLFR